MFVILLSLVRNRTNALTRSRSSRSSVHSDTTTSHLRKRFIRSVLTLLSLRLFLELTSRSTEPTTSFPSLTALPPLPPLPPLPSLPPPPPAAPPPQPSLFFPLPSTAPTAAAPPVALPPDLLLRVVASVRLQVDVAFPPAPTESAAGGAVAAAGEEERENEAFAKFVKVEELLAWVIQRVGDLPTCAEGRGEGVGAAEVEPGRNEIERAVRLSSLPFPPST